MSDKIFDSLLELKSAAAITTDESGTGKNIGPTGLVKAVVIISAKSGTNPTLDLKIQECDELGGTYEDVKDGARFNQITAVGVYVLYFKATKAYVRYDAVVGGTSPSFTTQIFVTTPEK